MVLISFNYTFSQAILDVQVHLYTQLNLKQLKLNNSDYTSSVVFCPFAVATPLRNIYYSLKISLASPYWVDVLILASGLAIALLGIGSYGFYEPYESHFAMVAQEMIWRNDWIVPHLNGSPYLNKSPLLYWLIAISTYFFGSTEFSARLPVALAGWLGVIIAWKWARELWGINSSRVCAIMLSVTLGWFIFTHQILIDVLLATLLLSSNFFLWRLLKQPKSDVNWWSAYI